MVHKFYGGFFLVVSIFLIVGTSFKCSELKESGQKNYLIFGKYLKSFDNVEVYKWVDLERMWAFHAAVAAAANNHQAEYFIPGYLAFCPQYMNHVWFSKHKRKFFNDVFTQSSPLKGKPKFHHKTEKNGLSTWCRCPKPSNSPVITKLMKTFECIWMHRARECAWPRPILCSAAFAIFELCPPDHLTTWHGDGQAIKDSGN